MDTHRINTAVRYMWGIVLISILAALYIHGGIAEHINLGYGSEKAKDLAWFASAYLSAVLAAYVFKVLTEKLIANYILMLAIGKLVDLFIAPYGFHFSELIWLISNTIYHLYKWIGMMRKA